MTLDSIPVRAGFRGGHIYRAYNEAAFHHFLAVERSRARRAQRFVYLVLAAIRYSLGQHATLTDTTAAALLRGLSASVREVDFVGWYEEGRVAAAVLAQGVNASDNTATVVIADRVRAELRKRLSASESNDLRIRVVRLGARA
jgi:hypothetical protein